jgi:Multimeric flavodoxin WrbA
MKTVIVSFSSRTNGNCSQIGKLIASLSHNAVLFDFSEFSIQQCGHCAAECFTVREGCPYFADKEYEILEAIMHGEMVYFVLPNYCDYPNANFFIFNERSQCFFQGRPDILDAYLKVPKRSIVISNTNKDNFIQALAYQSNTEPEILFLSAKEYGKKSINGDLLTSEKAVEQIRRFINKSL